MKRQKDLIHNFDWDCLVILDACRYDYFENVYDHYLEGSLKKVDTECFKTPEWIRHIFSEGSYEDIVYVSATPHITNFNREVMENFVAIEHFYDVMNVWDSAWNSDFQGVPPKEMGKATRKARMNFPSKRIIAHFNQPHYPYLSLPPVRNVEGSGMRERAEEAKQGKNIDSTLSVVDRMRGFLGKNLERIGGQKLVKEIRDFLGLRTEKPSELTAKKYGKKKLQEAYRDNLEKALSEVVKLAERLPDKIIVTSDHGELLGENGLYGHGWNHSLLREVPWLEVEDVER